nr:hypothetical protein [Neorhizobium galegae]
MGHNEEPAPYVTSAGFERAEQARFDRKTQPVKVPEHIVGSQGHVSLDVFEEAPLWIKFSDDPGNVWPEVTRIIFAAPLSGE